VAVDLTGTDGGSEQRGTDGAQTEAPDPTKLSAQIENLNKALAAERERARKAQEKLDAAQTAEAERKRLEAESQGQFEPLYKQTTEKLTAAEKRIQEFEAREQARAEAMTAEADSVVDAWSDEDKALDPRGLSAEDRLKYVRALDQRLKGASQTVASGTRSRGGQQSGYIHPDAVALAKRIGREPKDAMQIWLATAPGRAWLAQGERK